MDIEKAMKYLVKAARELHALDQDLENIGFRMSPVFHIYGCLADGIFHLIGESTNMDYGSSMTCMLLKNKKISDDQCVQLLLQQHELCVMQDYLSGFMRV